MKKSWKRILCGGLSLLMVSSLALEGALRLNGKGESASATADAKIEDVTGKFNTSALREQYFNDEVKTAEKTYETRTVMVTLDGAPIADRTKGNVAEYLNSKDGKEAVAAIASEQAAFLRQLTKTGVSYEVVRSYNTVVNAVAVKMNTRYVSTVKGLKGVDSAVITTAYAEPKTYSTYSTEVVENKTEVYETGIYDSEKYTASYGQGSVVAILDTGLDYTHSAFQNFMSSSVELAWSKNDVADKLNKEDLVAESRSGALEVSEVYVSEKVPYAYDYADDDPDVYPSYSNHGTHVAGIIGGYDGSYTDKDGNLIEKTFKGVVPDAQLAIFKVFTDDLDDPDLGGAVAEDIVAALEDCVKLDVDVINMSLGTSCGFTTTDDGDDEGEMLDAVYNRIKAAGISLVCAASNDYSSGYGGTYGTNLAGNPDSATVGSPSTYPTALSVASINGQKASYFVSAPDDEQKKSFVFFEESRDIDGNPFDFVEQLNTLYPDKNGKFEYVVIPGVGQTADYSRTIKEKVKGRIALVKRGNTTFQEKVETAMSNGAMGVIVYNNVAGMIRMNLGEIDNPVPSVSVSLTAGNAMVAAAKSYIGTISISDGYKAGPFMSEFSSWGPTPDLRLKPEITAHGGEITSTVPGGYGEQSGTSMASPNMAGFITVVRNYIEKSLVSNATLKALGLTDSEGKIDAVKLNSLAMQLTMSTAATVYDQDDKAYSPRKQGAGVAKLENVIDKTKAFLWTDVAENDYRPKIEMGDDADKEGRFTNLKFKVTNFGSNELTFKADSLVMTETLSADKMAVAEQAYMLDDTKVEWTVGGVAKQNGDTVTVAAGATVDINVTLTLSDDAREYIDESFENGMYVEGYLKLLSTADGQCDLSIPFLGFYGDWDAAPMLDYTAFEVAASEKDLSVKEEDKISESVWATLPYTSYYNEKYVLPMGGYVYLLPENDEKMYVMEEHCAVSRYNEYYGEGNAENYLSSTGIKAVYAGLFRNARVVKYRMYNEDTGELILEDEILRVGKAFSGGGQATPANVELELSPEEYSLASNGKYRMEFEFFREKPEDGEVAPEQNTYQFSFTVDYEAPRLEDARIRYYNYKDGNDEKQKIYLDLDVYDNHYAMALMLCYPTKDAEGDTVLQLATEYPTPIRDAKRNSTNTVSIDITDIYQQYGDQFYVQIDDYAVNSCLYKIDVAAANDDVLPAANEFELAKGQDELTLDRYQTHKVSLIYGEEFTNADPSNFLWTSLDQNVAIVRNGEIVGISEGTTIVTVSRHKGGEAKQIEVTVTDKIYSRLTETPKAISFDVIKTASESVTKAAGAVEVNAGVNFKLKIMTDPWYHPMTGLLVKWETSNPTVATIDQSGNVETLKKGTAIVKATVYKWNESKSDWEETLCSTFVTLKVQNEFRVSNYTLQDYNGVGYNAWLCPDCGEAWLQSELETLTVGEVIKQAYCPDCYAKQKTVECVKSTDVLKIPTDMNIWYIGEEAFKDNTNIKKVIIPSSTIEIAARAFMNCTALEEVHFVSMEHREKNGVTNPLIDWADLSIVYENAFSGCKKLKKVDLSNVKTVTLAQDCFADCTSLAEVVDMPSIGTMHHRAFANCKSLTSVDLTGLHMSGNNVFNGCTSLASVTTGKFTAIGDAMFANCTGLKNPVTISCAKVGASAFSGCVNLTGVKFDDLGAGLEFEIGANAFRNCGKNATGFAVDFNGEKVRAIGDYAFAGAKISSLSLDWSGLESLGSNAFSNSSIAELIIDDGFDFDKVRVTGIPFDKVSLKLASGSTKYEQTADGVIYSKDKKTVYFVPASLTALTLPAAVENIGAYAFANSKISALNLSNIRSIGVGAFAESALGGDMEITGTLTEIPERAFYKTSVKTVKLPDTVTVFGKEAFATSTISGFTANGLTTIGDRAFAGCTALIKLDLPQTVKTVGNQIFSQCTSLEEVTFPAITKLGENTFQGATSLRKVTFDADAETIGAYTFAYSGVRQVVIGGKVTKIGEGAFYYARALTSVALPDTIEEIGFGAFEGTRALKSLANLDKVRKIGVQAFYGSGLEGALNLAKAEEIGNFAFASADINTPAKYTSVSIPNAKTIGNYAFFGGSQETVTISPLTTEIGEGAFANAKNFATIAVENGNNTFFVEENVLYRYIDKTAAKYEIVCYPAARAQAAVDGVKSYSIKEGTVIVKAYAFYGLKDGGLNKVVLPYSVNIIGDSAFFDSGVQEYSFESIQAPVLETVYRDEIAQKIEDYVTAASKEAYYKGYYYSNFQTYLYDYTEYGKQESKLIINRPKNGVGYSNHIYKTYFGTENADTVMMEDNTRACIALIEAMPTAAEVSSWLNWTVDAANTAKVKAFAQDVKTARLYYDNAFKNPDQAAFISQANGEKLLAVETALRAVKERFNIPLIVTDLRVAESSTHKTAYKAGEIFDPTGLVIVLVYDDGSTEIADAANISVKETTKQVALTKFHKEVTVVYTDGDVTKELLIKITVTDGGASNEQADNDGGKVGLIIGLIAGGVVLLGGAAAIVLFKIRKGKNPQNPSPEEKEELEIADIADELMDAVEAIEEVVENIADTDDGAEN